MQLHEQSIFIKASGSGSSLLDIYIILVLHLPAKDGVFPCTQQEQSTEEINRTWSINAIAAVIDARRDCMLLAASKIIRMRVIS